MNIICLDEKYSTTKFLTEEKPELTKTFNDNFNTILFSSNKENRKGEGGLRTKGYFKKSFENKPLVSIVTVVYNGEKYLEETIQSVINQTYDNVEYIIIDGGSTDGTLDIIKKNEDKIDYWVSEKDRGIYDAMNKGIDSASGDWINFMNAGDGFYINNTLKEIFLQIFQKDIKCIYGNVLVDYGKFQLEKKAGSLFKLYKGMQFSHQSLFVRLNYHKNNKFDLSYKSAADYDLIYNSYINHAKFLYIDIIVSNINNGGLSDIKRIYSIQESKKIVLSRSNTLLNRFHFYRLFLKIFLIDLIKKVLPSKIVYYLQGKR